MFIQNHYQCIGLATDSYKVLEGPKFNKESLINDWTGINSGKWVLIFFSSVSFDILSKKRGINWGVKTGYRKFLWSKTTRYVKRRLNLA